MTNGGTKARRAVRAMASRRFIIVSGWPPPAEPCMDPGPFRPLLSRRNGKTRPLFTSICSANWPGGFRKSAPRPSTA
jgi:hypothetical protein